MLRPQCINHCLRLQRANWLVYAAFMADALRSASIRCHPDGQEARMQTSTTGRRGCLQPARSSAGPLHDCAIMLTLFPMSGTSSAAIAAAWVTTELLDARPAVGSCATENLGLTTTGLDTSADCMAATLYITLRNFHRAMA